MNDKTPLRELKGVGEKTEKLFQKIGITTAEELLRYYPRTYDIYELSLIHISEPTDRG